MKARLRAPRALALVALCALAVTSCKDTTINQHAGGNAGVCQNSTCLDGGPSGGQDAPSSTGSPSTDAPSTDSSAPSRGDGGQGGGDPGTDGGTTGSGGSSGGGSTGTDDQVSSAAPGPATPVRLRYLTEVRPIGGYGNNEGEASSQLGDTVLPHSIEFAPGFFSKGVDPLNFNVPSGLTRFQATVGLDNSTLPDYEAHVGIRRRDGTTLADLTLKSGETYPVSEGLGGTNMITIDVEIVHWAKDGINSRPHVVVGDGRFVK